MGKEIHKSSGCEVIDNARKMQKEGIAFEEIGKYTEGNCSGDCDNCQFNTFKRDKPKIYFLSHGDPEVKIIEYDNVETEEQFQNMMAMALMIGNEDGSFNDKAFGYWNGIWYHSVPSPKEDKEEQEIPNEIPDQCLACDGIDFDFAFFHEGKKVIKCMDCGNLQYENPKEIIDEGTD